MRNKYLFPIFLLLLSSCAKDDSNTDVESVTISSLSFERALINIGIDTDGTLNGKISTSDISAINYLPLSNQNISDLSGLENFSGLKKLECSNNQLSSLDVRQNRNLNELDFSSNLVTSIDVSQNTSLKSLVCFDNKLTSLDISKNTALATLACTNNQLMTLDVRLNTMLTQLYCSDNQLTGLDVSQNIQLTELFCYNNQIKGLSLSRNVALTELYCNDNQLTSLNVKNGNNPALTEFNAMGNDGLLCISVDNETSANQGNVPYNVWFKDATTAYSENCNGD